MSKSILFEKVAFRSRVNESLKTITGSEITVFNTFVYNPNSKSSAQTAESWVNRTNSNKPGVVLPLSIEDNVPIELTIVDLDVRAKGGRAYRVIDDKNRLFDLREDQLLEAIAMEGISPGGKINGKFQWGLATSQTKLVFVGGELHKEMVEGLENQRKIAKLQKSGDLFSPGKCKPGGIYKRDKKIFLYVGKVRFMKKGKATNEHVLLTDLEHHCPPWKIFDTIMKKSNSNRQKYEEFLGFWKNWSIHERLQAMIDYEEISVVRFSTFKSAHQLIGQLPEEQMLKIKNCLQFNDFITSDYEKLHPKPQLIRDTYGRITWNQHKDYDIEFRKWQERAADYFKKNISWL